MFDYLQKFNSLPKELRDKVSGPEAMRSILDMESKYRVDLAALVMKVMVKSIPIDSLVDYFRNEFSLNDEEAKKLNQELLERVFSLAADHLGIKLQSKAPVVAPIIQAPLSAPTPTPVPTPASAPTKDESVVSAIKAAGIILPSSDLFERLEKILSTYQKGIRSKIDTRASLSKKVEFGGLNLSDLEIEKLFKALAGKIAIPKSAPFDKNDEERAASKAKLDRIIMQAESAALPSGEKPALGGYDLKKSIEAMKKPILESGESLAKIDLDKVSPRKKESKIKELEAPDEIELLPLEEKELLLAAAPIKKEEPVKTPEKVKQPEPVKVAEMPPLDLPVEAKIEKTEIKSEIIPDESEQVQKFSEPKEEVEQLPVNLNFKRPEPLSDSAKPRIQDIKPVPRVMSPVEELQFLDLVNFRRLGANPTEITDKIFAKIKLLERDGYDKMIQGVSAWRKSETNRLYLKIGQEAVMEGISLKEAILNRQKANKPYLNLEEIEAISGLNSRLSF